MGLFEFKHSLLYLFTQLITMAKSTISLVFPPLASQVAYTWPEGFLSLLFFSFTSKILYAYLITQLAELCRLFYFTLLIKSALSLKFSLLSCSNKQLVWWTMKNNIPGWDFETDASLTNQTKLIGCVLSISVKAGYIMSLLTFPWL